jgi:CHAT domain-containing protein/Tfp pilus assembly protein PilF
MVHRGEHRSVSTERKRQTVYLDMSTTLGIFLLFSLSIGASLSRTFERHLGHLGAIRQSTPEATQRPRGDEKEQDRALQEARKLDHESEKLYRAGKYDEALALAERVWEIRERILGADHLDVAQSLNLLALLYEVKSEYAKAEQLYGRALAIWERTLGPEHPNVAIVLGNLAELYVHRGEFAKAESFFERTLAIAEKAMEQEDSRLAGFLNGLAALYYTKTEYAKAEPLYERALAIWETTLGPEHPNVAKALDNLAIVCASRGKFAKAKPLYGRALAIREKVLGPEHIDIADSLHNLASFHHLRGEYEMAEPLYERALAIWEKALGPEHPPVASALNNLAELYADMGEYAKAEPLYIRALAIRERVLGLKHPEVALILNNLAVLHRLQGEYAKAEPLFRRALAISKEGLGPENPLVALSFNNLAALCLNRGDYGEAESLLQKALAIREKVMGPEHTDVAVTLHNLANLYREQGEYEKAEPLLRRALAIWEKALEPEHPDVAFALNNLANIYCDQGNYAKAEPFFGRALAIREKVLRPEHPDVAVSLNKLADLYRGRGEYAKAEPLYMRALAIREKVLGPRHHFVAQTLNNLAALYAAKSDPAPAVEFQARANDIGEHNLALNLATGSERQKLAYHALLTAQTDFTLSLHSQAAPDDQRALDLALTILLRRKGRVLDVMADSIAILRRNATPENQKLFNKLNEARSQLAELMLKAPTMANPDTYRTRLKSLEEKVEKWEADLSAHSAPFHAETQPVTISSVQSLLTANSALVEFAVFTPRDFQTGKSKPPRYVAYVLPARGRPKWVDLGEAESIDRMTEEWREALRGRPDVKLLGREVDEKVMRPVRALLQSVLGEMAGGPRRLLIVPAGSLNLIPFAALVDEDYRYLVERYTISYLTSGCDLLRLQISEPSQSPPLVMGNPSFGPEPPDTPRTAQLTVNSQAVDQGWIYSAPLSFQPLSATQGEVLAIKAIMPKASVLLRGEATEAALKHARSPGILHIATHGFFLEDEEEAPVETQRVAGDDMPYTSDLRRVKWEAHIKDPLLRSGLALAGANRGKRGDDDGVLTALEAAGLDLRGTKLVVLSACDTGVGEIKNGEGVQGLRRALVLAGSESQVMSLWGVNDEGAKELMIRYYRALVRGEGRGEGLRKVQLRMLKSKRWYHPSHWAAFIQSGEWANLEGRR